ncbi:MAG: hypothetical protein HY906_03910 [Deltaproteobacteria bacterium]|nr:hypothetical protein [Deltaproteobacteria bacterium]
MEDITIRIRTGAVHVQHATCPAGCSLMAPDVSIGGFPSIRVTIAFGSERGQLYLDPGYGSFQHQTGLTIPPRTVVEMSCPTCGESLAQDEPCADCGARTFRLSLPQGGTITGCLRAGCHRHKLELADLDGDLLRLYERDKRIIL